MVDEDGRYVVEPHRGGLVLPGVDLDDNAGLDELVVLDDARLTTGGRDAGLDAVLSDGLDAFNVRATGDADQRELTVRVADGSGAVLAGLSGWTWGTCCGISMVWVREDARRSGWGARLLEAAEAEARVRGCVQVVVSSFTFQAPGFYERHGYTETGRTEGIPRAGSADVHLRKDL